MWRSARSRCGCLTSGLISERVSQARGQEPERWEETRQATEDWAEKAFLVGASSKTQQHKSGYTVTESLDELARLASSAGLQVSTAAAIINVSSRHLFWTSLLDTESISSA